MHPPIDEVEEVHDEVPVAIDTAGDPPYGQTHQDSFFRARAMSQASSVMLMQAARMPEAKDHPAHLCVSIIAFVVAIVVNIWCLVTWSNAKEECPGGGSFDEGSYRCCNQGMLLTWFLVQGASGFGMWLLVCCVILSAVFAQQAQPHCDDGDNDPGADAGVQRDAAARVSAAGCTVLCTSMYACCGVCFMLAWWVCGNVWIWNSREDADGFVAGDLPVNATALHGPELEGRLGCGDLTKAGKAIMIMQYVVWTLLCCCGPQGVLKKACQKLGLPTRTTTGCTRSRRSDLRRRCCLACARCVWPTQGSRSGLRCAGC